MEGLCLALSQVNKRVICEFNGSQEQMDSGFYLSHGEGLFIAITCFPEQESVGDFGEQKARAIAFTVF